VATCSMAPEAGVVLWALKWWNPVQPLYPELGRYGEVGGVSETLGGPVQEQ